MWRRAAIALTLAACAAYAGNGFRRWSANSYDARKALLLFAPASGLGMGAACACSAPTGTKGEALTLTRSSNGTCLKGNTTTSIADGDLVVCASDQARVMPGGDGSGGVGLLVEGSRTNTCLRSGELCNAAWADVGTPSCSANAAAGPLGTVTMAQLTDNDGAGFEGRSQGITTTSATQHSVSCFVKAGTATSASITLVGVGSSSGDCTGSATGLSTTTSSRVKCTSPAAYAGTLTSVTLTIRVGTVASDQGTIFVEGCQHEVSAPAPSSLIATTGASATRSPDVALLSVSPPSFLTGSVAATVVQDTSSDLVVGGAGIVALQATGVYTNLLYTNNTTQVTMIAGASGATGNHGLATSPRRFAGWWNASNVAAIGATQTTGAAGAYITFNQLAIGSFNSGGFNSAVIKSVCWDASEARCR